MYSSQDPERFGSGLPSIHNHSSLLDTGHRHRIETVDDSVLYSTTADRASNHVRFASSAGASGIREGIRESVPDSALFYPRPPSPTHNGNKKMLLELQDQVNMFREELGKRDKLIQQLTSMDTTPKAVKIDTTRIEETFSTERINALASCRSEIAGLQVKIETLNAQLMDTKAQLDIREEKIQQMKFEAETARENEAKQQAIANSLRMQVIEFETKFGSIESAASRGEVAVQTLQTQLKEANERILELESRLRTHMSERETLTTQMSSWERKYYEVTSKINSFFSADGTGVTDPEAIIVKVSELTQENASLRGKIYSMKEYTNNAELETKACRETIMRLVTEAEKEQKSATKYSLELDSLRLDRDSAVAKQRELEMEIKVLRDRCDSASNAMMATRRELEEKEMRFSKYENESRSAATAVRSMELATKGFREQLASLLSIEGHMPIQPVDEAIRDRVKAVVMALRDKSTQIEVLETKVKNFAEQLDRQYEMNKSADSRAKRVETDFYGLQEQIHKLEEELAAGEALRDGLRLDKDKYLRFMEGLAKLFNVNSITMDVGFDMAVDTLLAKADQLVRQENDTLSERKTTIYNLQRKIKTNKEQLESRDLHIDLLRKKVASMEERLNSKADHDRERETEAQRNKKLMKLSEKYKQELHHARLELAEMKTRLMEGQDAKSRTFEQERAIESLENKLKELDLIRHKQAQKITNLKDSLDIKSQEVSSKHEGVNNTIQALTGELRATKSALDEVTQKERQLLDLRQVVARMLGLDINSLAVPDYEIIARLEKLILAQQSSGVTVAAVDNLMDGLGDGFRAGYEGAGRVFQVQRSRSPARKVTTIKNSLRTRSRSMSPSKKKDNRCY